MDHNQYKLICAVLDALNNAGVLKHMLLIGSWCLPAYEKYFVHVPFSSGIRTRDIDFLIPTPLTFRKSVNLEELFNELGFVTGYYGEAGYTRFVHADLMLEFIVPERGRGCDGAYGLPVLGINAQPLRFMDYLCLRTVHLTFGSQIITVPHPARFALLKLLVSSRRLKDAKRDNDLSQAERILRALFDSGEEQHVLEAYTAMPRKWRQSVRKTLVEMPWADDWMEYFAEDTPYNKKY